MMRTALLVLALLSSSAFAAEAPDPFEQALAQARARRAPVLVDFTAPWCYSCYYMAKNVLTGPEWDKARRDTVAIELDADSPEGTRWMKAWSVKAMPTYLVFNADGEELGRILGEQTRTDFYRWLNTATSRSNPLDTLKASVTDGSKPSVAAAREVLRAYHARYDATGGLAWHGALAAPVQTALAADAPAAAWVARLRLQQAAAAKDAAACLESGEAVLAADLGCERPYELDKVLGCSADRPELAPVREELLRAQVKPMQSLLDTRVFARPRCADERSVVLATADLYGTLGEDGPERVTLDRAIAEVKKRIGGNVKKDRSLSDNLRVYLDRAGRTGELDALLLKLIAAYPNDYVYAYRYARSLAAQGQHGPALPYYEKAAAKAYGVNKLRNAELRARSLQAVGRNAEARQVLAEALQANGPWFPEDAAKLKALMDQLPPLKSAS